jgi:hypothetical protein
MKWFEMLILFVLVVKVCDKIISNSNIGVKAM